MRSLWNARVCSQWGLDKLNLRWGRSSQIYLPIPSVITDFHCTSHCQGSNHGGWLFIVKRFCCSLWFQWHLGLDFRLHLGLSKVRASCTLFLAVFSSSTFTSPGSFCSSSKAAAMVSRACKARPGAAATRGREQETMQGGCLLRGRARAGPSRSPSPAPVLPVHTADPEAAVTGFRTWCLSSAFCSRGDSWWALG